MDSFLDDADDAPETGVPIMQDPSLQYSDDEDVAPEVMGTIEDPDAEYQRYLVLERDNLTKDDHEHDLPADESLI